MITKKGSIKTTARSGTAETWKVELYEFSANLSTWPGTYHRQAECHHDSGLEWAPSVQSAASSLHIARPKINPPPEKEKINK